MKEKVLINNKILIIILSICLFIPTFMQYLINLGTYKQLIIGSIVNASLFLSALYIKNTKIIIGMSTLPSISNILSGLLFASLTKYATIMIPFIWIGNLSIIYVSRFFMKRTNYYISSGISIFTKVFIIYCGFLIVSNLFNYPSKVINVMNVSMGITQLYTCISGFILSVIIDKLKLAK